MKYKLPVVILVVVGISLFLFFRGRKKDVSDINLAIAWSNTPDSYSYVSTKMAAEKTGANVLILDMVRSTDLVYNENNELQGCTDENDILDLEAAALVKENGWRHSNVEEVMKNVDCLVVPGGWDISPSLFSHPQRPHGIEGDMDFCSERDVSDYLLISYCLEKDIPIFCICRGMQMLAVVSGAEMIQDIGTYFAEMNIQYDHLHRKAQKDGFVPHPVKILSHDSLLYRITKEDVLEKCPSWHHQAVGDVNETDLTVTGVTDTSGIDIIEAIERKDLSFCLGVQFHPEVSVRKQLENEADVYELMGSEVSMLMFDALVKEATKR